MLIKTGEEMSEKPIHVQVAEALGCKLVKQTSMLAAFNPGEFYWACGCRDDGYKPGPHGGRLMGVYNYETDWSATGPLIERYRISLDCDSSLGVGPWCAIAYDESHYTGGASPLLAVCHLILALKAAGKLEVV